MSTFCGAQLTVARMRRGLNKTELANAIAVTPKSVADWEAARACPREEMIGLLARELDFPPEFFFGRELELPDQNGLSFRALTTLRAGQRDAARASGAIAIAFSAWLEERFQLPSPDLPDLSDV